MIILIPVLDEKNEWYGTTQSNLIIKESSNLDNMLLHMSLNRLLTPE